MTAALRCGQVNRQRVQLSLALVCVSLYGPFGWILTVGEPWSDYRWFWLKRWPVLPGILPSAWLLHGRERLELLAMGLVTTLLMIGLTWLGSRGRVSLVVSTLLALLVSVPSAMGAYHAFRA